MSILKQYRPFFASATLMCIVLFIIYPHYQYYVDPDGTAYLTISRRYAEGDFAKAINGYWSPWSCWLTALLMKTGLAVMPAAVIVNTAGAAGVLYISQSFFLRFKISVVLEWLFNITLALFLTYAVFDQSFDDLWECFFLLCVLRLMISAHFKDRPALWVLCGVVGALAYFAKAYAFPFFILNVVCCSYFLCRSDRNQWLKVLFTAIGVMVLVSLPWISLIHSKYGIWTTSTAGSLNMSWYLVGHPYWKEGIHALIPPVYPDSPYYWEDPWVANGKTPHFWDSWYLFGRQFLRLGQNVLKLLRSMVQISVFFPLLAVVLGRFVKATRRQDNIVAIPNFSVALSFLLFPLGYMLINFEARYIWYMLPLSMLAGALFILNHLSSNADVRILKIVPYVLAVSYLVYPAWRMVQMYDEGKADYRIGSQLKKDGLQGTFTSVAWFGYERQRMARIAYFSGISYFDVPNPRIKSDEMLSELKSNNVNYYFYFLPDRSQLKNFERLEANVFSRSPEISKDNEFGMKIFQINP